MARALLVFLILNLAGCSYGTRRNFFEQTSDEKLETVALLMQLEGTKLAEYEKVLGVELKLDTYLPAAPVPTQFYNVKGRSGASVELDIHTMGLDPNGLKYADIRLKDIDKATCIPWFRFQQFTVSHYKVVPESAVGYSFVSRKDSGGPIGLASRRGSCVRIISIFNSRGDTKWGH